MTIKGGAISDLSTSHSSEQACPSFGLPEAGESAHPSNACQPIAPQTKASSEVDNSELASLCKALGHPARVQILKILIARQSCICGEIVEVMPLAQSTVSEHLRILKKAGLVQGDVDGTRICYCVNPIVLERLKGLVSDL